MPRATTCSRASAHSENRFMTTSLKSRLCFLALLFLSICFGNAQAPAGVVSFSLDNTTAPVFDLTGGLSIDQQMQGAASQTTPLAFSVDLAHDAKGKLTGSGITAVNVGNDFVAAQYTVKGRMTGGGNRPNRATFTVKLKGEDTIAGVTTRFVITIDYNLEADIDQLAFVGSARGSANFTRLSGTSTKSDVSVGLAAGMDGSWSVDMNIVPLKRLAGSASFIL